MTICIAAISEDKNIIALTDKMLTLGAPVATRFEVDENDKAVPLGGKTIGLFAGDVVQANEILNIALHELNGKNIQDVQQIAEIVNQSYRHYWKKLLNDNLFQRFSMSLDIFMANQKNLDEGLVKQINDIIGNYNIAVEIIVAGKDTEPRIYGIINPGVMTSYDSIGYKCIGSGTQHATLSLIESEYHSKFNEGEGLRAIFEAKKRAEYDPGVGKLCDIVIINDDFTRFNQEQIKDVDKYYDIYLKKTKNNKSELSKNLLKIYGNAGLPSTVETK